MDRCLAVILLSFVVLLAASPVMASQRPLALFGAEADVSVSDMPEEARWRALSAESDPARNYSKYRTARLAPLASVSAEAEIELVLVNDVRVTARRQRLEDHAAVGLKSWIGSVEGDSNSRVVLTQMGADLSGELMFRGKSFVIRPLGEGVHLVAELSDPGENSREGVNDVITIPPEPRSQSEHTRAAGDDGSVIDLLVAYTAAASGATSNIITDIANDVAVTNAALDASCAGTSIRLVGTTQVSDVETGDGATDLARLRDSSDGFMDGVHALRDSTGADLVQIWVNTSNVCGMAYMSGTTSPLSESWGFGLKLRSCSGLTTAHELGHNLDLNHDRWTVQVPAQANTGMASGYGFVAPEEGVRDIMSYDNECSALGFSCVRLGYFSNPRMIIKGQVFGIPDLSDAVTKIRQRSANVASFRAAVTAPASPSFLGCQEQTAQASVNKCFIATAAFGSPLANEVGELRRFRDQRLMKFALGRKFIDFYYRNSPSIAQTIAGHEWMRFVVRVGLYPVVAVVRSPGWLMAAGAALLLILSVFFFGKKWGQRFRKRVSTSLGLGWFIVGLCSCFFSSQSAQAFEASPPFLASRDLQNASVLNFSPMGLRFEAGYAYSQMKNFIRDSERGSSENRGEIFSQFGYVAQSWAMEFHFQPEVRRLNTEILSDGGLTGWESSHGQKGAFLSFLPFRSFSLGLSYLRDDFASEQAPTHGAGGADGSVQKSFSEAFALNATVRLGALYAAAEGAYLRGGGDVSATGQVLRSRAALGFMSGEQSGSRLNIYAAYNPESISGGADAQSQSQVQSQGLWAYPKTLAYGAQGELKLESLERSLWLSVLQLRAEHRTEGALLGSGNDTQKDLLGASLGFAFFNRRLWLDLGFDREKKETGGLKVEGSVLTAALTFLP